MGEQKAARMMVVADEAGNVLAAVNLGGRLEGDAPLQIGVEPLSGQTVHDVDVPEELIRPDAAPATFREYRLETEGERPRLIKRSNS